MKSEQKEKEKCRPFLLVLCHVVISYSSSSVTSLPIPSIPACSSLCLIDLANTIFTLELESLLDPLLIHVAALRLLLIESLRAAAVRTKKGTIGLLCPPFSEMKNLRTTT